MLWWLPGSGRLRPAHSRCCHRLLPPPTLQVSNQSLGDYLVTAIFTPANLTGAVFVPSTGGSLVENLVNNAGYISLFNASVGAQARVVVCWLAPVHACAQHGVLCMGSSTGGMQPRPSCPCVLPPLPACSLTFPPTCLPCSCFSQAPRRCTSA